MPKIKIWQIFASAGFDFLLWLRKINISKGLDDLESGDNYCIKLILQERDLLNSIQKNF